MAKEFTINGIEYTHMKLDAFTQLHVSRKTAPLFVGMAMDVTAVALLHDISQNDLESTLKRLMPFVRRKDGGAWAKIYSEEAGRFIYDDIGGGELLQIMFNVLLEYLPQFFQGIDQLISGTQQQASEPQP